MFKTILMLLVALSTFNHIECQFGQFGFPFANNMRNAAQSSFNPQQQRPPGFTFGGDFFYPQDPFAVWGQQQQNQQRPQQQNQQRPQQQNQQRPTTKRTTLPPPPPPTRAPTRPPVANVLPNRVGGRISETS